MYADEAPGNDQTRKCSVMSEVQWFRLWEETVKQAAVGRMVVKEGCLGEEYRVEVERSKARRETEGNSLPPTGSAVVDGALGLLRGGLNVMAGYNNRSGWGADT